jgi:hypothetical protein
MNKQQQNDKPTLHLTDAKEVTLTDVLDLFRKLTGREPTAEEVKGAWAEREKSTLLAHPHLISRPDCA